MSLLISSQCFLSRLLRGRMYFLYLVRKGRTISVTDFFTQKGEGPLNYRFSVGVQVLVGGEYV